MQKMLSRLAVTAGAVTTVVALTPGVSLAAQDVMTTCGKTKDSMSDSRVPACRGKFFSERKKGTEALYLSDTSSDGRSVAVVYYRYDLKNIGPYYKTVTAGYYRNKQWTLKMREGTKIRFKVCTAKGGSIISSSCSRYVTGIA